MKPNKEIEKIREMARTLWRHREYDCEFVAENALVELFLSEIEGVIPADRKHRVFECNGTRCYEDWCEKIDCPSQDNQRIIGFNSCRSEILTKIKSLKDKENNE